MNKTVSIFAGLIAASLLAAMVALAPAAAEAAQDLAEGSTSVMRTPLLLPNAGFESGLEQWAVSPTADTRAYEFAVDTAVFHSGKQSIRIRSTGGDQGGAVYQVLPIAALRGKTVELGGWLKTENATGDGAALTRRVFDADGRLLEYNLMYQTPLKGTTAWKRYSIPVKVSKNAMDLELGVRLNSKGTLWADDLELNVISHER
jgi:hypothetical protein